MTNRDETIQQIRHALRARSGKAWSITGGRGTAWGWITISSPPARRVDRYISDADRAELGALLGLPGPCHMQGEHVAASSAHYREYVERAQGLTPTAIAQPYWD